MAKRKPPVHGSVVWCGLTVWVQDSGETWSAWIENPDHEDDVIMVQGRDTQEQAELALLTWLRKIVACVENGFFSAA